MPDMRIADFLRHDAQAYGVPGSPSIERILEVCVAAANWIDKLEFRLAQVERERDALLDYLGDSTCAPCDICKHDVGSGVMGCKRIREIGIPCFEWRGVCAENTEEKQQQ